MSGSLSSVVNTLDGVTVPATLTPENDDIQYRYVVSQMKFQDDGMTKPMEINFSKDASGSDYVGQCKIEFHYDTENGYVTPIVQCLGSTTSLRAEVDGNMIEFYGYNQ